jgi:hypothetical protein
MTQNGSPDGNTGRAGQGPPAPELDIDGPGPQRRLTVAFRALLAIPHVIVLLLLGIAAAVVLVLGWFAALALGRLPGFAQRYLSGYLGYGTRLNAYLYLLVDRYPPFALHATDYPVHLELYPTRLNRLAVLFRIILAIPAVVVAAVLGAGWEVCAFFLWLAVLIVGRTPEPVFGATAAVVRYQMRLQAYTMLLSAAYPRGVFGEPAAAAEPSTGDDAGLHRGTRPLMLSQGARVLLIVFIVAGVLGQLGNAYRVQHQLQHLPTTRPSAHALP